MRAIVVARTLFLPSRRNFDMAQDALPADAQTQGGRAAPAENTIASQNIDSQAHGVEALIKKTLAKSILKEWWAVLGLNQ